MDAGADVNLQGNDGWSPLHYASSEGHVDIVRALAEAGAKPSLQAVDGRSALHVAVDKGDQAVLRALADAVVLRDL